MTTSRSPQWIWLCPGKDQETEALPIRRQLPLLRPRSSQSGRPRVHQIQSPPLFPSRWRRCPITPQPARGSRRLAWADSTNGPRSHRLAVPTRRDRPRLSTRLLSRRPCGALAQARRTLQRRWPLSSATRKTTEPSRFVSAPWAFPAAQGDTARCASFCATRGQVNIAARGVSSPLLEVPLVDPVLGQPTLSGAVRRSKRLPA